jgi:hypothetical protein
MFNVNSPLARIPVLKAFELPVYFGRFIRAVKSRGHCMCKEMPVIPVNKVVDPKRIIRKKWRAKEEERHKGLLTPKNVHL